MRRYCIAFYAMAFIFLSGCVDKREDNVDKEVTTDKKKVIAYVRSWNDNWGDDFEKAKQITHINFAFANIKNGIVVEGIKSDSANLKKLNQLKQINRNLKILISVGGWSWSKNFSDAVLTEQSRHIFANSAIDFLLKHELDGIDLDWEYPGQKGDNNMFRPQDKENFTSILKLIRKKLDSLGGTKNHYLLTIATGANQKYLDHTNMKEAHQYLDFINIMTYDYYTGGSRQTGHHANLYRSNLDNDRRRSGAAAVKEHVQSGIPIEKIVLGVPFYGRSWKGVNPNSNGLYQKASGKTSSYSYKTLNDSLNMKVFKSYWDSIAMAPYIWRDKDSLFISYENEHSLKNKANFVNQKGLGGIMFWEFNHDNGDLLNTITEYLDLK